MEDLFNICVACVLMCVTITVGSCSYLNNMQDNTAITELIKQGVSANDAYCAIRGSNNDFCKMLVAKKEVK